MVSKAISLDIQTGGSVTVSRFQSDFSEQTKATPMRRDNLPPVQRAHVKGTHRPDGANCSRACLIRLSRIREDCLCLVIELLHEALDADNTLGGTGVDTVQVMSPEEDGVQVFPGFLPIIQILLGCKRPVVKKLTNSLFAETRSLTLIVVSALPLLVKAKPEWPTGS